MLKLIRVDDNLLHGQVALSWIRNLHIHQIVIANNEIVDDGFVKMTLGLSKPPGVELLILSIPDAIAWVDKNPEMNLLVIVKNITDVAKFVSGNPSHFKKINLGLLRKSRDSILHYDNLYMTQNDIDVCRSLIAQTYEISYQLRYTDKPIDFQALLREGHMKTI